MKTFGKIMICIFVILLAIGSAYFIYDKGEKETNSNTLTNTNSSVNNQNTTNNKEQNKITNEIDKNEDYTGIEENIETPEETETPNVNEQQDKTEQENELTGKDKAIDIIKKKYAIDGQTVRFDHMEGTNYVIKINAGTAVTWYLVDGITWEANEY